MLYILTSSVKKNVEDNDNRTKYQKSGDEKKSNTIQRFCVVYYRRRRTRTAHYDLCGGGSYDQYNDKKDNCPENKRNNRQHKTLTPWWRGETRVHRKFLPRRRSKVAIIMRNAFGSSYVCIYFLWVHLLPWHRFFLSTYAFFRIMLAFVASISFLLRRNVEQSCNNETARYSILGTINDHPVLYRTIHVHAASIRHCLIGWNLYQRAVRESPVCCFDVTFASRLKKGASVPSWLCCLWSIYSLNKVYTLTLDWSL